METYLLTDEIEFDAKPDAVPYNYRISYKLSQICLIIARCCSGRSGCSLVKLHILSSALNTRDNMDRLEKYINEQTAYLIVRFDPAVNRAVNYALVDELILHLKNGTLRLTDKGKALVKEIREDNELMVIEKEFLSKVGKKLTAEKIDSLMSTWRYRNVED